MKKILDPDPKFKAGETLYDQYIVGESTITIAGVNRVSLTCTSCGTIFTHMVTRVASGNLYCPGCRRIQYDKVVKEAEAISHRVCRGCKRLLPKENFRPRIGCKNYINPWCKECEVAKFKHPENLPDPITGLKRCALCKEALPLKRFAAHPHNPDGLKSWCEKCNWNHYQESLIKRGLRPSEEEKQRMNEEKAKAREEKVRAQEEQKAEAKKFRERQKLQFLEDKRKFYEDVENKRKPYRFDFWKKGYYN